MSHFGKYQPCGNVDSQWLKIEFFSVYSLKIKISYILFFKSDDNFTFTQFCSEIFQFIIELISFHFKEIISIIKNNDHKLVFDLMSFYLFAIIVKFSNFIEFVFENIFILNSIQINIKIHAKYPPLN